jgi:hypothetical protein
VLLAEDYEWHMSVTRCVHCNSSGAVKQVRTFCAKFSSIVTHVHGTVRAADVDVAHLINIYSGGPMFESANVRHVSSSN